MNTENLIIGLALVTIAFISIDLTRTLLSGKKPRRARRRSAPQRVMLARCKTPDDSAVVPTLRSSTRSSRRSASVIET